MSDKPPRSPFDRLRDLDPLGRLVDSTVFRQLSEATAASHLALETADALKRHMREMPLSALEEARAAVAPMTDVLGSVYEAIRPREIGSVLGSSAFAAAREQLLATETLILKAYPAIGDVLRDMPRIGDSLRDGPWIGDALENVSTTQLGSVLGQFSALVEQARETFTLGSAVDDSILGSVLCSFDPWSHLRVGAGATHLAEWHRLAAASRPSLPDIAVLANRHDGVAEALQHMLAVLRTDDFLAADAPIDASPVPGGEGPLQTPEIRGHRITLLEDLRALSPVARFLFWIALLEFLAALVQLVPRSDPSTEAFQRHITQQIATLTELVVAQEVRQPIVVDRDLVVKRGKGEGGTRCVLPPGSGLLVVGKSGRWLLVEILDPESGKPGPGWVLKHHLCR
jgi:hypothetical protein